MRGSIDRDEVLQAFEDADEPVLTAPMIAEKFDITQQAAHRKLSQMNEDGYLNRMKVGGRAVVWWVPTDQACPASSAR